jgi:hypothetical protein
MNFLQNIPKNHLRGELIKRGLTLGSFARKKGYPETNVYRAFARHCGEDTVPIGKLTRAIIRDLYEEIQSPIEPITTGNSEDAA